MASTSQFATFFRTFILVCTVIHGAISLDPVPSVDCKSSPQSKYPFCDPSRSPEDRASDLISRLSIEQMIAQTSSIAPAIPELGINAYNWRSNCLHGWSASGGHWTANLTWTVFPAPIGLGASFDPDLVELVGSVTSDEGRALHNLMLAYEKGESTEAAGLNCFSPNVNILRDPRWGRLQESFSEDPYLLSVQGAAYSKGLQFGEDKNYLKIGACAKHYVVHNGPDNTRARFIANTSLHDLYDTYLPAFKSQVYAAKVSQIMPAYSGVNCSKQPDGAPDVANKFLLWDVLRTQFEAPNISIISDNGGVSEVYATHKYVATAEEAAAVCMNASNDLDLGHDEIYPKNLMSAVSDGLVTKDTIAAAVWRSFYLRIILGDFDPIDKVVYQTYDEKYLDNDANKKLNLLAAQKSIVLLKNKENSLPLNANQMVKGQLMAIIGPNSDTTRTLLSNYEGVPSSVVSVADGIRGRLPAGVNSTVIHGCSDTKCSSDSSFNDAVATATHADYVVMVMGLDGSLEGEGHDRVTHPCNGDTPDVLSLPGCQGKLIESVAKVHKVILVLINGGPLSLGDIYSNDNVVSILEVFYPGALGGEAVASVLFGDYNPAGRMPVTTYTGSDVIPEPDDYDMTSPPGRTYRYYTGVPEIPFGFGLSYTTFSYSNASLSKNSIDQCDTIDVKVIVTNTGSRDGEEVVQLYLSASPSIGSFVPKNQLIGYQRISVKSSDSQPVAFTINAYLMSLVDENGVRQIYPGKYTVYVGGGLPGKSTAIGDVTVVSLSFVIKGSQPKEVSSCSNAPKCLAC
jgi:beta-glucosidase